MPFCITRESHGVYKKFSGFVTVSEFLESVFATQCDPDYDRLSYTINDLLDVTDHAVRREHVEIAASYALGAEYTNRHLRIAVVSQDQTMLELLSSFRAISNYQVALFATVSDARNWLLSAKNS